MNKEENQEVIKEQTIIPNVTNDISFDELPKIKEKVIDNTPVTKEDINFAQQRIIILNQEINKKYGFYDDIRRKTLGVINSLELNVVDKNNLDNIVQENILKAPSYWLTYAMSALSYWYMNNKSSANTSLNKAMQLDNQKTSLFFAVVCASNSRDNATTKWIKRYLDSIDPHNVNNEVILIVDAIASGLFGIKSCELVANKTKEWIKVLEKDQVIFDQVKDIWLDYYDDCLTIDDGSFFPYLKKFATNYEEIINSLSMTKTNEIIFDNFKGIMESNEKSPISYNMLIEELINSYDQGEVKLKEEINKNQDIVNGNHGQFVDCKDFLSLLSITILDEAQFGSSESRKLIFSLLKNVIIESINEYKEIKMTKELFPVKIKIDEWEVQSTDASNEVELHTSLHEYYNPGLIGALKESKYINAPIIIIPGICILLSLIYRDNTIISIILCALAIGFAIFSIINTDNKRKKQMNANNEFNAEFDKVLNNIMAEIVDYSRLYKITENKYNDLIKYLNDINNDNFIKNKEVR